MTDEEMVVQKARKKLLKTNGKSPFPILQRDIGDWQNEQFQPPDGNYYNDIIDHKGATEWQLALGIAEEAGELCRAILKHSQGIRGYKDRDKMIAAACDALADLNVYGMSLCNVLGVDFETICELTTKRVLRRDWIKHPEDADKHIGE